MKTKTISSHLEIKRHFTSEEVSPLEMLEWESRDVSITAADGTKIFAAENLEFPKSWSQNATNIVAQKYLKLAHNETSLKQMVGRVVDTIKSAGIAGGYFSDEAAEIFADELTYLLVSQRACFNSPVWFNIGVEGTPQQSSACFILSVDDSLDSILKWISEEGKIFKGGSGSGVNLSNIRSSKEKLSGGGSASGPVSFMRGADASAGAIRSGGTTRRAAKMVVLDADHPDISEFIWCKALEERKSKALAEAGFNMSVDGTDTHSIQYQNANNSVRLSQDFFDAVKNDADWHLTARQNSEVLETLKARQVLDDIARAAWECADPGVQYDTTINTWHTTPNAGRISASNPCSEYFHLDNSACNLSSLNLLAFYDFDLNEFDVEGYKQAVSIMIIAQEILVGYSDYPMPVVEKTARAYRQLGLGYANLGALLMSMGLAYDSPQARAIAACLTALMTGQAYLTSAKLAAEVGPFEGYENDKENMLRVLEMHRDALDTNEALNTSEALDTSEALFSEAKAAWDEAREMAKTHGVRNSQVTVLAPTGTISFMMDCDTTGIEPDLALVKFKQLVGGGSITITNQSVEKGLRALNYNEESITKILDYISNTGVIESAPDFSPEHRDIFACAIGKNCISPEGHILMMSAVQPFISGGISKTVNLPSTAKPEDIAQLLIKGNELGLKALAIYRDNSKVSQPLTSKEMSSQESSPKINPKRKSLPRSRNSKTFEFQMSGCKGYVTVGEYDTGEPGEIFVRVSKQGSTLAGTMDAFAIAISHGLQYGVPLASFIDAFSGMRFEPIGVTDDSELRFASSIIDYIFRRLALMYLTPEERAKFNIYTTKEREQLSLPLLSSNGNINETNGSQNGKYQEDLIIDKNAPFCTACGYSMVRSGSCYTCTICGNTSGCS